MKTGWDRPDPGSPEQLQIIEEDIEIMKEDTNELR